MRVSNTPKRYKNRSNGSRSNGSRRGSNVSSNNYEGNGKIKGNAIQVHEKYQALARDAISSGDTIKAEYYFQHAEHYHRVHKTTTTLQSEKNTKNEKENSQTNKNEKIETKLETESEITENKELK